MEPTKTDEATDDHADAKRRRLDRMRLARALLVLIGAGFAVNQVVVGWGFERGATHDEAFYAYVRALDASALAATVLVLAFSVCAGISVARRRWGAVALDVALVLTSAAWGFSAIASRALAGS